MDIKIAQFGIKLSSRKDAVLPTDGVPLNWSLLVRYLHAQGVTDSPQFSFPSIRNDAPKNFSVRLFPRRDASDTDGRTLGRHGFGSASSPEESMSRAVGELLERYSLSVYRRESLYSAPLDEARAKHNVLDIYALNDYLPWQKEMFPAYVRTDDRPITWVSGRELLSDTKALIPAQLAHWNYKFENNEMVLAQPDTNGGAGHFTRDEAVLSALLELIQRDGFLIYWLNALSPKVIDTSTIVDKEIKDFLKYLHRYRLEYYFLNTTTDIGVPSCACVLIDVANGDPIITVGGGSGFALKELIFQSAGEALAVYAGVSSRAAYVLPDAYKPFSDRTMGRDVRLSLWRGRKMHERFKFFVSGGRQSFEGFMGEAFWHDTPAKRLAYVLDRLRKLGAGYEAYVFEAVHPVLTTLGYHAVKAVVPRLMHLYLNEHMATLAAPRLRDVPSKLGYTPAETLNPLPHPFP